MPAFCLLAAGCQADSPTLLTIGQLGDQRLDEASGLVQSRSQANLYWLINDEGKPRLFAAAKDGTSRGAVSVNAAKLRDWEDLAAFVQDDRHWLLIADIGNNQARRDSAFLYAVPEPAPDSESIDASWYIEFSYPDGPRDAESIAVSEGSVYVLSKRDVPARLYRLPLQASGDEVVTAEYLGPLDSLPQPSPGDLANAAHRKWYWQPTAMDFAVDDSGAVILTYGGVYYYPRKSGQSWLAAFSAEPVVLIEGDFDKAESVAISADGRSVLLTYEGIGAPIRRIALGNFDLREKP